MPQKDRPRPYVLAKADFKRDSNLTEARNIGIYQGQDILWALDHSHHQASAQVKYQYILFKDLQQTCAISKLPRL